MSDRPVICVALSAVRSPTLISSRTSACKSGRDVDKFKNLPADAYDIAENGIRFITAGTNAYFSLKVEQGIELVSHTLFICEPTFMTVLADDSSCTYEYYQSNSQPK